MLTIDRINRIRAKFERPAVTLSQIAGDIHDYLDFVEAALGMTTVVVDRPNLGYSVAQRLDVGLRLMGIEQELGLACGCGRASCPPPALLASMTAKRARAARVLPPLGANGAPFFFWLGAGAPA